MGLTVLVIVFLMVFGARGRALIPTRSQSIAELAYGFIYKMVEDVTGKDGVVFFSYIMTLFMFIVVANFFGSIANGLYYYKPHCCNCCNGNGSIFSSDHPWVC